MLEIDNLDDKERHEDNIRLIEILMWTSPWSVVMLEGGCNVLHIKPTRAVCYSIGLLNYVVASPDRSLMTMQL